MGEVRLQIATRKMLKVHHINISWEKFSFPKFQQKTEVGECPVSTQDALNIMHLPWLALHVFHLVHMTLLFSFMVQVVYADISKAALYQQQAIREPAQSTVYSSLRFSQ